MNKKIFASFLLLNILLPFFMVLAKDCGNGIIKPDDEPCPNPSTIQTSNCLGNACPQANIKIGGGGFFQSNSLAGFVAKLTKNLMIIAFIIAPLLVLYGAITIMFAQGESDKITKGRNVIIWTLVGLAIFLAAKIISNVVISAFTT